jgi:hypothetical protein
LARSKTWEGLTYRSLELPGRDARELFSFVGAWAPSEEAIESGWGAWAGSRLVGALLLERAGSAAMLHGPVVRSTESPPADSEDPSRPTGGAGPSSTDSSSEAVEVAIQLLAEALTHAGERGIETLFTRPQGLDRVWVRSGFIPVPEVELPRGLRGRPGIGLFAWRGGSAIWSAAGRGAARPTSRSRR